MVYPSRREFRHFSRLKNLVPVASCLPLEASPQDLFEALCYPTPSFLLESARTHPVTGRYSVMVAEPDMILAAKGDQVWLTQGHRSRLARGNPLFLLQQLLDAAKALRLPGFPPFVGGAVGFFGYDAYRYIEPLPTLAQDDLNLPDLYFLLCHRAIVIDHLLQKVWAIALADPARGVDRSYDEAVSQVDALVKRLQRSPDDSSSGRWRQVPGAVSVGQEVRSTHTRASFEAMVRRAKGFIAQGEIYQANLSQRFSARLTEDPWALYQRLSAINPSPFAAFADCAEFQVACASPERLLRVDERSVETRPIAGTRPRGRTALETARLRQELALNEKERAEHLMLVDLERNDLGRISRYGSVRVDEMMILEEYSHVIHIVSNVRGTLRPSVKPRDVIAAAFPGGTITGCPKIRSIQIIDELEPVRRQLYTGSLGYISYTGDMDLNLVIRTALVVGESVHVQTGAGIVADSDPSREYEETLHKAKALLEALHADTETVPELAQTLQGS